jgi:hypothetical protein
MISTGARGDEDQHRGIAGGHDQVDQQVLGFQPRTAFELADP